MVDAVRSTHAALTIDGDSLTMEAALAAAADRHRVELAPAARARVARARQHLETLLQPGAPLCYGINTGLGPLKHTVIGPAEQAEFQRNILRSHSVTWGDDWDETTVRLAMLLRANVLARGHSGVRPELIERLLLLLNSGVTPCIQQEGSLGLGDLPPMAALGLTVAGMPEGRATWQGRTGSAPEVLRAAGVDPVEFPLAAREALALVSGSTLTLAAALQAWQRTVRLLAAADAAAALTLESVRGETAAFAPALHAARPHPGQQASAARIAAFVAGSEWAAPAARQALGETTPRVQDAISLRCTPQVHGAARDTLAFATAVFGREINVSTDNPLLLPRGPAGEAGAAGATGEAGPFQILSGGHSHAAPVAYASDFLAIAVADLAVLSDRRAFRLLDPHLSYGLPPNLVDGQAGLSSGLAVAQSAATALLAELRALAQPATAGSLPTKAGQEDHVSHGLWAARKLLRAVELAEAVIAMEVLLACRAIDLLRPQLAGLRLGAGSARLYDWIRSRWPAPQGDFFVQQHWQQLAAALRRGEWPDVADASEVTAL